MEPRLEDGVETVSYFAIGIWHPKHEDNVGTLWRSAYALGAAFVFTVGRRFREQASDTTKAWRQIPMFNFRSLDDLREHLPHSCALVGVELDDRATRLEGFAHPPRAVYLLGAEDHGLSDEVRQRCHRIIQLPGTECLNVAVAGSIVMYDRTVKGARERAMTLEPWK